jgi:hypothetical protein
MFINRTERIVRRGIAKLPDAFLPKRHSFDSELQQIVLKLGPSNLIRRFALFFKI